MPMPYTFTLSRRIPASPQEIYDAWLDSAAHSEMTGGEARMSDAIGADVSALNGYITGRNLQLIAGERIVQSWRTTEFADEHADSVVTVMLEERADGALLTLVHSNVPDDQRSYEEGGWQATYFEPMIAYFGSRAQTGVAARRRPAGKPRRAAGRARRAPGARAKSTAPRAKARAARKAKASAAKKPKHAGAKSKRKPARAGSRKAARPTASRRAPKSKSGRRKKARR
jgi:uncharacterized protein YndB with AHSA1/START domain